MPTRASTRSRAALRAITSRTSSRPSGRWPASPAIASSCCDNTFVSEASEHADRLRDPSHVRNYGAAEWRAFFERAGLRIDDERQLDRPLEIEPWLARAATPDDDAARVRELLGDRVTDGSMDLPTLVLKGVK